MKMTSGNVQNLVNTMKNVPDGMTAEERRVSLLINV